MFFAVSAGYATRAACRTRMSGSQEITELLKGWNEGDAGALERLLPHVEAELRRIAQAQMRREGAHHTLQPTALVNEAFIQLLKQNGVEWQNSGHFYAIAATLMRRILTDYARRRLRAKRGGGAERVELDEASIMSVKKGEELIALDEALDRLAEIDPLKSRIVELRHFGGMGVEETAKALNVAPVTVIRH